MATTSNNHVTPFTGDGNRRNTNSSETESTLPDSNRPSTSTLVPSSNPSPSPSPSPYNSLPLSFNIYYKKWFSSTYQIGQHESDPLFTIQRHGAWGGDKAMIILYSGADTNGPIVGTVTKAKDKEGGVLSHDTIIELPLAKGPKGVIRERLESDVTISLKNSQFRFSFDIPVNAQNEGKENTTCTQRETFEWRISKATEVRSLDSTAFGWKLVRLGVDPDSGTDTDTDKRTSTPTDTGKGGARGEREVGQTSDGKEVVAAWSENSGMTLSKIAKFHFLGSGATGEFGDDWALMVALSAFRLWKFTSGSISVRP